MLKSIAGVPPHYLEWSGKLKGCVHSVVKALAHFWLPTPILSCDRNRLQ